MKCFKIQTYFPNHHQQIMDNLITHLEKTLNDDECVQEALLLLKNLEKLPDIPIKSASENNTNFSQTQTYCNEDFARNYESKETVNPELVALYGLTSFLKNDFELPNELPLRIIAFRLNVSFQEMREICRSNSETIVWQSLFFDLCLQIIDCFENKYFNTTTAASDMIPTITSIETVKNLRLEIEYTKTKTEKGTVTDFVRTNIGRYLEQCAAPMALGDANFGHCLVTQEVLLDNIHTARTGRVSAPLQQGSGEDEVEEEDFLGDFKKRNDNNTLCTLSSWLIQNNEATSPQSTQNVSDKRVRDLFASPPSSTSAIPAPSDLLRSNKCRTPTFSNTLTATAMETEDVSLSSVLPLSSSSSSSSSLFKLAPLVEFPRCPKHFIVPLMEPDLLGDFRGVFAPSICSLGMDAGRKPDPPSGPDSE